MPKKSTRLTVKYIEELQRKVARGEKVGEWHSDGGGLVLRVRESGHMSYVVKKRPAKPVPLGPAAIGLAHARKLAQEVLVEIARGGDPAATRKAAKAAAKTQVVRDSVEAVVASFVERHCVKLRTGHVVERVLNRDVVKRWKGRRFGEIGRVDVNELLDALVDRGAPIQANRLFAYLNKLCRWALSRGLIQSNPCDGVTRPSAEKSRDRVLDDRELALVWRAAETLGWPFEQVVKLLILTGARKSEIAEGNWPEIDLDAALWRLPPMRVKNKRGHEMPLAPAAVAILKKLPRVESDEKIASGESEAKLVFSTNGRTAVSGFSRMKHNLDKEITKLNGGEPIPEWTIHDLRRSMASGLARIGIDLVVIERCLNHVSGSFAGVVQIYQKHKFEDQMRDALERWGRHVEALVSGNANDASNVIPLAGR